MNTLTITSHAASSKTFERHVASFLAGLRRLIELAGAPYVDSPLAPL
ncbi:hypothetical protein SOM61_16405 [Massilia sp. CFBP9012]|nr:MULTISPECIES: hypothetical protein [Massilia]MDY0976557.1 hypothetical protein [Massilia sp. CFBP9012]